MLARARQGDRTAQGWLIETHQNTVFRLALRLCHQRHQEAEELAQEALYRALKALPGFRGDAGFGTWIHRIVVNLHLNQTASLSHRARRRTLSIAAFGHDPEGSGTGAPAVELRDPGSEPGSQLDRREELCELARAIEALDEERRVVVVLRDLEGQSYQEIAEALEVPVGTVRSRLFRAREELRARMSDYREGRAEPPEPQRAE